MLQIMFYIVNKKKIVVSEVIKKNLKLKSFPRLPRESNQSQLFLK